MASDEDGNDFGLHDARCRTRPLQADEDIFIFSAPGWRKNAFERGSAAARIKHVPMTSQVTSILDCAFGPGFDVALYPGIEAMTAAHTDPV
jgi:hypothetical protein